MDTIALLLPNPSFLLLQEVIKEAEQPLLKEILLLCRYQGTDVSGNLASLTDNALSALYRKALQLRTDSDQLGHHSFLSYDSFLHEMHELLQNPLFAGAAIMSIFLAPYTREQVDTIKLKSIMKEITVMDRDNYFKEFNWNVFTGSYAERLHPDIEPNPRMAKLVHRSLETWRDNLAFTRHRPTMSNKLLPTHTRDEMSKITSLLLKDPEHLTQADLEWLRVKHQLVVEGPCEVSQVWYTNQVTPRTYYVAGPSTFWSSRYTKDIWNQLADALEVTQRRNRVNPSRIHIPLDKDAIFYDLTSFTSNCGAQRSFLDFLANWVAGQEIDIFTIGEGVISMSLEDLIKDYNADCNFFPKYRSPWYHLDLADCYQGIAGFLGVIGNISTCTFIHGAVLLQLAEYVDECGCAGDDAVIVVYEEEKVWACVKLLGILAQEKTFRLSDGPVVYLKRRTDIFSTKNGDYLTQSRYFQMPSCLSMIGTSRLKRSYAHFRESQLSQMDLVDLMKNSLSASFRSAAHLRSSPYFSELYSFMESFYARNRLPTKGFVPQFNRAHGVFVPALESFGMHDFVSATIISGYPGWCYLPTPVDYTEDLVPLKKDIVFKTGGSLECQILKKMGVVELLELPYILVAGEDGLEKILDEYSGKTRSTRVYRVKVDFDEFAGCGCVPGVLQNASAILAYGPSCV